MSLGILQSGAVGVVEGLECCSGRGRLILVVAHEGFAVHDRGSSSSSRSPLLLLLLLLDEASARRGSRGRTDGLQHKEGGLASPSFCR